MEHNECLSCFSRPAEPFGPYGPGDEFLCLECAEELGVQIEEEPEERE
jgi:hypothetical protein